MTALLVAAALCGVATILDSWSTQVGIEKHGFKEANSVARWFHGKIGIVWYGVLQLALLAGFGAFVSFKSLALGGLFFGFAALVQFIAALGNYKLIRRAS
jgi:uncharacterized membrane protein